MPKIYTKTGDFGKTSSPLLSCRVNKSDEFIELGGALDELCSYLGVVMSSFYDFDAHALLIDVQRDIFEFGFNISSGNRDDDFWSKRISSIEESIDHYESKSEPLENFILPHGSKGSVHLHHARTICRRVETKVVGCFLNALAQKIDLSEMAFFGPFPTHSDSDKLLLTYINRLSDLLFVMARHHNDRDEIKWESSQELHDKS